MLTRRTLLQSGAALAAGAGIGLPAFAQSVPLKIGYVSPQTGPLSPFAAADSFMVAHFEAAAKAAGFDIQVIVKDSQSNPNRAAEVAKELISRDEVNLIITASTPETTNPVCTIAEAEQVPVISTVAPWQPWFIGQQGNPNDPASWQAFDYVYHFFWGLEDCVQIFMNMWAQIDSNKAVGALWPNDGDGNAWASDQGMPPALAQAGYTLTDTGRYQNMSDDFSAQINAFKQADVQILTGIPIPPDFTTFWTQAKQQGFSPKMVSVAKALLFPESVVTLGDLGNYLTSEVWWSPAHPFTSSLTGETAAQLARAMATKPQVILLDEIAGGLTDGECRALVDTIRDLHRDGVSIIWIEHVLHALTSVVSRLLVLNFGAVVTQGAPAEVMAAAELREIYLGVEA